MSMFVQYRHDYFLASDKHKRLLVCVGQHPDKYDHSY